jgi:hypothetical protein
MNTTLLNTQPWRFIPGDQVYVRGWDPTTPALITGQIQPQTCEVTTGIGTRKGRTFPAYYVMDSDGHEWQVPQIALSRQPVVEK